jgi:hypothetical protein
MVGPAHARILFIGLDGAAKTIIDGGGTYQGWRFLRSAVITSLTFRNTRGAVTIESQEVRLIDLMIRDNKATGSGVPGVWVPGSVTGVKVYIVGSTFLDNTGETTTKQIDIGAGAAIVLNTLVWGASSGTMVGKGSGATLAVNNTLVKGQTFVGTGNLAGNVDPKLNIDGHLLWDSPLRGAGAPVLQSRMDMDGELRPNTAPDIGVDQFNDSDGDELADQWESDYAGNLTTLTGRVQNADGDGFSNEEDYFNGTDPMLADTDGDGASDSEEVLAHHTDPLSTDTDRDGMPDGWEVVHGLAPLVVNAYDDDDGDRYPNVYEYTFSTDPGERASIPVPTYVVNGAGGGTHTTISAALNAYPLHAAV